MKHMALAMVLATAASAAAKDTDVARRVQARVDRSGVQEEGQVTVRFENGKAVLEGAVSTPFARMQAEKAARKETKAVDNRLRVVPEEQSDEQIVASAQRAILGYVWYTVFDSVGLGVENGVVTLTGSVLQPYRKTDIEERVAQVAGVREVRSEIRVQSVSTFDEALRLGLFGAIYESDRFVNFSHANPPVRIVVDRGRVTLTGVVGSKVERVMLGSIARSTMAFGVDNQVQVESETLREPRRDGAGS